MEKRTLTKKAAETRRRLLTATLQQVAEHGYHNITADDIAKACGMSTGSAYRYFKNKKEMLLAAIESCYANIQEITETEDDRLNEFDSSEEMLEYVLERFIGIHIKYRAIHEELESLRHIDADVRALYERIRRNAVEALIPECSEKLESSENLRERLYVAIELLESCAHMQMDDSACESIDRKRMRQICIAAVQSIMGEFKQTVHEPPESVIPNVMLPGADG